MRFFYWGLLWLFVSSTAIAQQLVDTVYLDKNFIKMPDKSIAAYVQYTVFTTPARKDGLIKTFYITGEKHSEYLIQSMFIKATGYNREWYQNGQLRYEQQIENNVSTGVEKYWYNTGQLYSTTAYDNGHRQGEALMYYRNGGRKRLEIFDKGKFIQGKCFTQTGQDTTYFPYEQLPVFPGGLANMYKYISKNIKYSKTAAKQKAQGNVILQFVVTETGRIDDIVVVKSLHPDLDKESVRVVAGMPAWEPGRQDGIPVSVRYTLPIKFSF